MANEKKKMGRPALAKRESKRNMFTLRLKDEEIKEIQIIAEQQGLTVSEWSRNTLLKAIQLAKRNT